MEFLELHKAKRETPGSSLKKSSHYHFSSNILASHSSLSLTSYTEHDGNSREPYHNKNYQVSVSISFLPFFCVVETHLLLQLFWYLSECTSIVQKQLYVNIPLIYLFF